MIICVPTPLKRKYTPDISYIVSAVKSVTKHLHKDMLVVLESTTYPGTTEELIKPELEKSGLKAGKDFHVAFSPERIDPGNKNFDVTEIPKVVGGLTKTCTELSGLLYSQIIKTCASGFFLQIRGNDQAFGKFFSHCQYRMDQ